MPADAIREDIFERRIPLCTRCKDVGEEGLKETTPASPEQPAISGKASTSSTGLVGTESDLEVPETSAANIKESCDKPSEPSYVPPKSVMKPDIVFFGEGLPDHFHQVFSFNTPLYYGEQFFCQSITEDKAEADLLIVIGSSLKVRPVALIPSSLPENVPQVTFVHVTLTPSILNQTPAC